MALQTSGPISLANIQGEFGGSAPISLSEYYRGGPYTTGNNTNVPASGAISLGNFYGATRSVTITYGVIGGGGGGGGGWGRLSTGGFAGGYSQLYGSGFTTQTSYGGGGGAAYLFASTNGESSYFGGGGVQGINAEYNTPGSGGNAPASSYGAGGGGGGSAFDGYAGGGGYAAAYVSGSTSITPGTVLTVIVGGAGSGNCGGGTCGGSGAGGRVLIYINGTLRADYTTPGTYYYTVPAS